MKQRQRMPNNWADPIEVADFMEVRAIQVRDKNTSAADLISASRIAGNGDVLCIEDVMREIEARRLSAGEAYPFDLMDGRLLQVKRHQENFTAYLFCLCLSYFGWKQKRGARINPWYLFEDLCCIAAGQYLGAEVFKFGWEAKVKVRCFSDAVNQLCAKTVEGEGFKKQEVFDRKDDGVDLVAWRTFNDKLPSKILMFGQCAAGDDWEQKIYRLQPEVFWDQWIMEAKISPLVGSFYIPHRIAADQWRMYARKARGVLFDRCRIAYWAFSANDRVLAQESFIKWCHSVMPELRENA